MSADRPIEATLTLGEVIDLLDGLFPQENAQSWDKVGLVAGDPEQLVGRVLVAVDPTLAVIADAEQWGADLLLTHHPLLLRGVNSLATTSAKGAAITALVLADLALFVAHTNADSADPGVNTALAQACGITNARPLSKPEDRPLGLVGELPEAITLRAFAEALSAQLPPTNGGIRVAGPPDAMVRTIALLGGSGDSEFAAVQAAGSDVFVTADLRHHPVLEERERSRGGPPYLIDAGHYATESLWCALVAKQLQQASDGRLEVQVSDRRTDPWEFVIGVNADPS